LRRRDRARAVVIGLALRRRWAAAVVDMTPAAP
jgi:hypothetical protein